MSGGPPEEPTRIYPRADGAAQPADREDEPTQAGQPVRPAPAAPDPGQAPAAAPSTSGPAPEAFSATPGEPGARVGGRYVLGPLLGFGGMAEVFRGRDQRLGRDVAVKILRADLARDPTFQARFRREAQASASLNHPSIVQVFDTGEEPGPTGAVPYIVMEYVAGRTLREVLHEEGRLLPRRAMDITAEVCAALEYSHRAGIIHRDIKPANVMLSPAGAAKVMDFGIARAVTSSTATMTQTAAVIGTAQYLSPEQARGETVDARSDIYSAGCLLYELLTGLPPFRGESPVAVAYQHVREEAPLPSTVDPDLPPAADSVVRKAMAKNPDNRYQSAEEFRLDLQRAAAGQRVVATPVMSEEERTSVLPVAPVPVTREDYLPDREPETSRGPVLAAIALVVLLLLGLGGFLLYRGLSGGDSAAPVATREVPDVRNKPVDLAEQQLKGSGFTNITRQQQQNAAPVDTVVGQVPDPLTQRPTDTEITLQVSNGPGQTDVPDLRGKTLDEARKLLQDRGLGLGSVNPQDGEGKANTIASQTIPAGTVLDRDQRVDVTVFTGEVLVPSVVGLQLDAAEAALTAAGLKLDNTATGAQTDPRGPNYVLQVNPSGGTKVRFGSGVSLVLSRAPEPTPPPTTSAPPTTTSAPPSTTKPPTSTKPPTTSAPPTTTSAPPTTSP